MAFGLALFSFPFAATAQEVLTAKQIQEALNGKIFNVDARGYANESAVWAFHFEAQKSQILASPLGTPTFGLEQKGDQICNTRVPAGPLAQYFKGCFDVIRKGKSYYFNRGKRKVLVLRKKGVVQ
ncbi:MAG: hypothetical protein GY952_02365 [Rhodobacteraceae bacterium]|nr:hypothetical protein [Paracoccaceae bacterium]